MFDDLVGAFSYCFQGCLLLILLKCLFASSFSCSALSLSHLWSELFSFCFPCWILSLFVLLLNLKFNLTWPELGGSVIWPDQSWVALSFDLTRARRTLSFDLTRAGRALSFDLTRAGWTLSLVDYSSSLSSNICFIVDVWWFGWCFFLLFPGLFVDFVGVFVYVFLFLFDTFSFSFVTWAFPFLFSMLNPESVCFVAYSLI